ncbi:MAG: hypothetical protein RQ753_02500 [Desulfurivibrionaceae bacterium]|nr:hypothetical protein [Desulfurivibrionaceae bacterium]
MGKLGNLWPGRLSGRIGAACPEVLFWVGAVELMTILFVAVYETSPWIAVAALPIAFPPVIVLALLGKILPRFYHRIRRRIGTPQTVFLTFFACLLAGVLIFSLLLGRPMSLVFAWLALEDPVRHYDRWAANFGIAAALIIWLRCSLAPDFAEKGRW